MLGKHNELMNEFWFPGFNMAGSLASNILAKTSPFTNKHFGNDVVGINIVR